MSARTLQHHTTRPEFESIRVRDLRVCQPFGNLSGHGFVHVKEIGTEVEIFGMTVRDGDLVHADRHGALVIPSEVVPLLEDAIHKLLDTEKLVLDPARADGFDFDAFEKAWADFEASRT